MLTCRVVGGKPKHFIFIFSNRFEMAVLFALNFYCMNLSCSGRQKCHIIDIEGKKKWDSALMKT